MHVFYYEGYIDLYIYVCVCIICQFLCLQIYGNLSFSTYLIIGYMYCVKIHCDVTLLFLNKKKLPCVSNLGPSVNGAGAATI